MDLRSMFFEYPHGMWFCRSGVASGDSDVSQETFYISLFGFHCLWAF